MSGIAFVLLSVCWIVSMIQGDRDLIGGFSIAMAISAIGVDIWSLTKKFSDIMERLEKKGD